MNTVCGLANVAGSRDTALEAPLNGRVRETNRADQSHKEIASIGLLPETGDCRRGVHHIDSSLDQRWWWSPPQPSRVVRDQ